jgi:TPR repeat protein
MRLLSILILACLVLGSPFTGQVWSTTDADEVFASDNESTAFRNSGKIRYSPATYEGMRQFSRGHADKAYAAWVEEGWKGDLDALALAGMVCLMEETSPGPDWKVQWGDRKERPTICPVPARFWEDALVELLGEGEGALLLGLFGMELQARDPHRKETEYAAPVEAFMLRSAMAGNADGMFGAYFTGENRQREFIPLKNMPDISILPEKYLPSHPFESRFWLSHAAHAGNLYSMWAIAIGYQGMFTNIPPDVEMTRKYYVMAAEHGAIISTRKLAQLYATGSVVPQDAKMAIYYQAIAALLNEDGKLVGDNKSANPLGYDLQALKQGLMKGNLSLGGECRVFQPCLTEAEYQEAVARARPAYEKAKAVREKERAAQDALYNAARARLPEIRLAYEKALESNKER